MHIWGKFRKMMEGRIARRMQSDDTWTWSVIYQNKVMCKISAQHLKACKRKVLKTAHFLYSKFTKRHNSFINWRKMRTLELALYYIKTKSCAKFQLNMSEHAGENCGKLCISYILSSKRGITPSKTDATGQHSNVLCSTSKQSHVQNFSSKCQSM